MRWNPFKTNQRLKDMQSEIDCLRDIFHKHCTTTAHELYKLKNPMLHMKAPQVSAPPMTEEEWNKVNKYFENNELNELFLRGFARGGPVEAGQATKPARFEPLTRGLDAMELAKYRRRLLDAGILFGESTGTLCRQPEPRKPKE